MTFTILMGSPRKNGNTAALLGPFTDELQRAGHETKTFWLYDMDLTGCTACRTCQQDWTKFGCRIEDDMQQIFDAVMASDVIVLACPVYSWYCTAPMKAALDRLMYGMNKYYGEERGPSLWEGKHMALLVTCGYPPQKGADLFAEGMRRYCKHSRLKFDGMHAEHDLGYKSVFMDAEKELRVREWARLLTAESDCKEKER